MTHFELHELLDGTWAISANGVQTGPPYDHKLGCGTKTYPTREKARRAMCELRAAELLEEQRYAEERAKLLRPKVHLFGVQSPDTTIDASGWIVIGG